MNQLVHEKAHAYTLPVNVPAAADGRPRSQSDITVEDLLMTEYQAHARQAIDFVGKLGTAEEAYKPANRYRSHREHLARTVEDPAQEFIRRMTGPGYGEQIADKMVRHEQADPAELFLQGDSGKGLSPRGQERVESRVREFAARFMGL